MPLNLALLGARLTVHEDDLQILSRGRCLLRRPHSQLAVHDCYARCDAQVFQHRSYHLPPEQRRFVAVRAHARTAELAGIVWAPAAVQAAGTSLAAEQTLIMPLGCRKDH